MLLDIFLVTDACDKPDLLVGEGFSALFEHVCVTDMERVKNTIGIDSQDFLLGHVWIYMIYLLIYQFSLRIIISNIKLFFKFISTQRMSLL